MNAHRTFTRSRAMLTLTTILGLLASSQPAHAGNNDRIFAGDFDPCCQIGGTLSGLSGSGLVLHLDAGSITEDRAIGDDGLYAFAASVAPGASYNVSIGTQPVGQSCTLANASGTMGNADIDNVAVTCGDGLIWDQGDWGNPWQ